MRIESRRYFSLFRVPKIPLLALCLLAGRAFAQQGFYDTLRADIERDYHIAEVLHQSVWPTIKKYGDKSKQIDSLNELIGRFDRTSLQRTVYILDHYGWLGKSQVGEVANRALFLAIEQARDKTVRQKYFPLLEKSAALGESYLSDMAVMKDRILVENGRKQWYGTQRTMGGKLLPVEDPKHLNDRRLQVGLKKIIEKAPE
jgi:hypothetical protein